MFRYRTSDPFLKSFYLIFSKSVFRLTSTSDHASMYRDFEPEEKAVFDHLAKRVPLLEGQLEAAMKLACDNLDKPVDAQEIQLSEIPKL